MSIKLSSPVTINIPSIKKADGTTKKFSPVILDEIDFIVSYDNSRKSATAIIKGVNRHISLWNGDAYDKAGQFTDNDVNARISEILGSNPAKVIEGLFRPPAIKK